MSMHTKPGDSIVYANPTSGHSWDQRLAKKHLQLGGTYIVKEVIMEDFSTKVILDGLQGEIFNSVMFDDESISNS